jgi:hypothetical protein
MEPNKRLERAGEAPLSLDVGERGMARQGYDLQLTRYDERGWRATFYTSGMEHSPTSATGTGWERTPWMEWKSPTTKDRTPPPKEDEESMRRAALISPGDV